MIFIVVRNVQMYSHPLAKNLKKGYDDLVQRVCRVKTKRGEWTGFLVNNTVLTGGDMEHDKEFDIEFYKSPQTSGFIRNDWGNIMELNIGKVPDVHDMGAVNKHPAPKQKLYCIGNFLGLPWTIATCNVELICGIDRLPKIRDGLFDTHTVGAPVFTGTGQLVGMVIAHIPEKDSMVIRFLHADENGKLEG